MKSDLPLPTPVTLAHLTGIVERVRRHLRAMEENPDPARATQIAALLKFAQLEAGLYRDRLFEVKRDTDAIAIRNSRRSAADRYPPNDGDRAPSRKKSDLN